MTVLRHPAETLVYACPSCDSAKQIKERKNFTLAKGDERYRCTECGARFDEPVEREQKATAPGGAAAKYEGTLAEMDPDDLLNGGATPS